MSYFGSRAAARSRRVDAASRGAVVRAAEAAVKRARSAATIEGLESRRLLAAGDLLQQFNDGLVGSTDDFAAAVVEHFNGINTGVVVATNKGNTGDIILTRYLQIGNTLSADNTFGVGGAAVINLGGDDRAVDLAVDSGNSIYVAGHVDFQDMAVARVTSGGTLDATFSGGVVVADFASGVDTASAVAIDSAGRVILAGTTDTGMRTSFALTRLLSTGAVDTSFAPLGNMVTGAAPGQIIDDAGPLSTGSALNDIVLDGDDILAGGYSTELLTQTSFNVARYHGDDGLLYDPGDRQWATLTAFGGDESEIRSLSIVGGELFAIGVSGAALPFAGDVALARYAVASGAQTASLSDIGTGLIPVGGGAVAGSVIVVGTDFNSSPTRLGAIRYSSTLGGFTRDMTYANGTGLASTPAIGDAAFNNEAAGAEVLADGSVLLVGSATAPSQGLNVAVASFDAAGDSANTATGMTNFTGQNALDTASAITTDSSGNIYTAGTSTLNFVTGGVIQAVVSKRSAAGILDGAFGTAGIAIVPGLQQVNTVKAQGTNLLVAGVRADGSYAVVRLNSSGAVDIGFGTGGTAVIGGILTLPFPSPDSPIALSIDSITGDLLVAGTAANTSQDAFVARLTAAGAPVAGFGLAGVAILPDLAAHFGNLDDLPGGSFDQPSALLALADGSIVIAGFTDALFNTSATPDFFLAKLSSTGALEGAFGTLGVVTTDLGGFDQVADAGLAQQSDGTIVAVGSSDGAIAVARYNPTTGAVFSTGTVDLSLTIYSTFTGASGVAIDSLDRILIAATLSSTSDDSAVLRLSPTGVLDPSFSGDGIAVSDFAAGSDTGEAIAITTDGTILVAGTAQVSPTDLDLGVSTFEGEAIAPPTNTPPTASPISGPTTGVSLFTLSYAGSFTDPDLTDTHTQAWEVRNAANVVVASGTGAAFSFTPTSAGSYTVKYTVTDQPASTSSSVTLALTVTSAAVSGGVLQIGGTSGSDSLSVSVNGAGNYVVTTASGTQTVPGAGVTSVVILAGDSADLITVAQSVTVPVEVRAGDGNDVLISGAGDDLLLGEGGDDLIFGRNGDDIAIGGSGSDTLDGANGRDILIGSGGTDLILGDNAEDILIAGTTDYDSADAAGVAALNSARTIWIGAGSFTSRVNTLRTGLFTPDVNIQDDNAVDLLFGGNGSDWFLFNSDAPARDLVLDARPQDIRTDVD